MPVSTHGTQPFRTFSVCLFELNMLLFRRHLYPLQPRPPPPPITWTSTLLPPRAPPLSLSVPLPLLLPAPLPLLLPAPPLIRVRNRDPVVCCIFFYISDGQVAFRVVTRHLHTSIVFLSHPKCKHMLPPLPSRGQVAGAGLWVPLLPFAICGRK